MALLALLALLSGAGLVVLVLLNLLESSERFRAQAELDAARDARQVAAGLVARLRDPRVLTAGLPGELCAFDAGQPVAPAGAGWVEPLPPQPPDPVLTARLLEAQLAEQAGNDPVVTGSLYDALLGAGGPAGIRGLVASAAAAWHAQRHDRTERAEALLASLDAALASTRPGQLADPELASVVASAVLLHHERGNPVPAWAAGLLTALPAQPGSALLQRLGDPLLVAEHQQALHARERLLQVQAWARSCARGPNLVGGADDPRILLWFPEAGAFVTTPSALAAALGADEPRARVVAAAHHGPDAESVVPGALVVLPRALPAPGWFAQPAGIALAVGARGTVFLGSALLAVRALRREAAAVRTRAEFLTVVTHELKTPLASIRLLAEMLLEHRVPPGKEAEYHRALAGEGARLSMLIENVLDLGRVERGERALDLRDEDALGLAADAVALFQPLAERDGLALTCALPAGPVTVRADRGAVHQALLNVLDNARKYAATGRRIDVTGAVVADQFVVSVRDHGQGIPEAEWDLVFERFRRGSAHAHGSVPGIGLGLHLARTIARRHGGELRCKAPAEGAGAVFVLELPCRTQEGAA